MMFVNGTWYNNYSDVEEYTGLTDNTNGCLTAFYDDSTQGSFGYNLAN
jgi:hypothetical protein